MAKAYPLEIENIGEDVYTLMSRGHHDIHAFMREVSSEFYWMYKHLGLPIHTWFKAVPPRRAGFKCHYVEASPNTRGAFPVTYVDEACRDKHYEALLPYHGA